MLSTFTSPASSNPGSTSHTAKPALMRATSTTSISLGSRTSQAWRQGRCRAGHLLLHPRCSMYQQHLWRLRRCRVSCPVTPSPRCVLFCVCMYARAACVCCVCVCICVHKCASAREAGQGRCGDPPQAFPWFADQAPCVHMSCHVRLCVYMRVCAFTRVLVHAWVCACSRLLAWAARASFYLCMVSSLSCLPVLLLTCCPQARRASKALPNARCHGVRACSLKAHCQGVRACSLTLHCHNVLARSSLDLSTPFPCPS